MNPKKSQLKSWRLLKTQVKNITSCMTGRSVVRLGGQDGARIKFKGEEEFIPHDKSNVFFEACRAGDQITKEEYDSY